MDDLQGFDSSNASAKTIAAELKDDFYSKLVDDFLGNHYGDLLELDGQSWKNRMLVQIGLLREEQDISWVDLIKWLQKIVPKFKTADFQSLIERNTLTATSLNEDARENFFDKDVNFGFVGPICDSIGIGRRDLLEMSDFSDRAKLTGLTNGLVLELTNFISREKLDPVVLVSWIRNFEPLFCMDGKIQKAYKLLRGSLKNFRTQYRNNQRSRKRSCGLLEEFLQTPFDLYPEDVSDVEYRKVLMHKTQLRRKQTNFSLKSEDDCFHVSHIDVSEKPKRTRHEIGVKRKLESDSHQAQISPVEDVDEDNEKTDTGDNVTLLDISVLSLQKMADVYGGKNEAAKKASLALLKNHFNAMLKNDKNLQSLDEKVKASTHQLVPPLDFLCYMCRFLFEFIDVTEQQIMLFEKDIVNSTGERLGRDNHPSFRSLLNFDESAVTRYIHMASEMLCPSVETCPNYRRHWLAFCLERNNTSVLPIYESNRVINYFEAAAGLIHHHKEFNLFVSDLQSINDKTNILLESVNADADDETLQMLVCVVAVVYLKVLGPFWQLLKSDGEYPLFSKYILCLYDKLLEWSHDATYLLQPDAFVNVFLQAPLQETVFKGVFQFCRENAEQQYGSLLKTCLKKMMKALAAVMEDTLKDFLPGGKHCKDLPADISVQMANCTFSQLMGEYPFGHAYPYENKRPDKSSGHTEGWASQEAQDELVSQKMTSNSTPTLATTSQRQLKAPKHRSFLDGTKLKVSRLKQLAQDGINKKRIIEIITTYGGPCKSKQDVYRVLKKLEGSSKPQIRAVIRSELLYQKSILCSTDSRLDKINVPLGSMISKLKDILPDEKVSVSAPPENVVCSPDIQQTPNDTSSDPQGTAADQETEDVDVES